MSFFEVEFPRTISYKAVGGPGFSTKVNEGLSGFEQRNKNWATSRGEWQVSLVTPTSFEGQRQTFLDLLQGFFLVVTGMGDAFRLFDHIDHATTGSVIGTGDGITNTFQLSKTYTVGSRNYVRIISKPITSAVTDYKGNALADTVNIYLNSVLQPTNRWSVDATTGVVTFATNVSHVNISAALRSGSNTIYTYTLASGAALQTGMRIVITGMTHTGNNGTFFITTLGAGTFTVVNTSGVTATESGTGITDWTPASTVVISADCQFHFPVRFDADGMQIQVEESNTRDGQPIGNWSNITLKEVRIAAGQSQG